MKKIIVLVMLFSITFFTEATASKTEEPSGPQKIEIVIDDTLNDEFERSANTQIIEAFLYSNIKKVEATLYNIGKAEVYIIDSQNQIINNISTYTDSPTTINFNLNNREGVYYIIIISDCCYAEGVFLL